MSETAPRPRVTMMPWGETLDELGQAARAADDAGVAALWTAELHRTATIPAAVLAQHSTNAMIGTGIAWAFCRSPMMTALTALDLDELSGGRFVLGLGSGVRRLVESWHGLPFDQPVTRLRQTVDAIRAVVAGAADGRTFEGGGELASTSVRGWERPFPVMRGQIPIYLAAVGPKMCQLAGQTADGWLGHELGSPRYLRDRILPHIEEGLRAAGRTRTDIDLVPSACCVIHPDGREARRRAAGLVGFYASVKTYDDFFAFHGFAAEAAAVRSAFAAGDVAAMTAAVTEEMVDALTLAGTADEVQRKLDGYAGLVDGIKLSAPTHNVDPEVTRAAQHAIITHLA